MKRFAAVLLLSFLATVFLPGRGWALEIQAPVTVSGVAITPAEFATLPEFLQAKVKYHYQHGQPEYVKWHKVYGPDYQHLHHLAAAMVKYQRALKITSVNHRNWALDDVLGEYKYLLGSCTPNFHLRYLFHQNIGNTLMSKGNVQAAVAEFTRSIQLNKSNLSAYFSLSEAYTRLGMQEESAAIMKKAEEVLKERQGGKGASDSHE